MISIGEYIRISVHVEYYYRILMKTVLLCD